VKSRQKFAPRLCTEPFVHAHGLGHPQEVRDGDDRPEHRGKPVEFKGANCSAKILATFASAYRSRKDVADIDFQQFRPNADPDLRFRPVKERRLDKCFGEDRLSGYHEVPDGTVLAASDFWST
jgi:hypothetical protein